MYGLVHFNACIATAAHPTELVLRGSQGFICQEGTQVTRQVCEVSSAPANLELFATCWHGFNRQAGKCLP